MITVELGGVLGKEYGRVHKYNLRTSAEVIRAMEANYPGFSARLIGLGEKGYAYELKTGKALKTAVPAAENVHDPLEGGRLRIMPRITGKKKGGIMQVIVGVALVALSFYNPMFLQTALGAMGATGATATAITAAIGSVGMSLALGGVAQMLAPSPNSSVGEEKKDNASYLFDGPVNTTAQGNPVPICYGEMIVGSAVISAGIEVDEIAMEGDDDGDDGDGEWGEFNILRCWWVNPDTGVMENIPVPATAWDASIGAYILPNGAAMTFNKEANEGEGNWFTSDDRALVMNTEKPPGWFEVENPVEKMRFKVSEVECTIYYKHIPLLYDKEKKHWYLTGKIQADGGGA